MINTPSSFDWFQYDSDCDSIQSPMGPHSRSYRRVRDHRTHREGRRIFPVTIHALKVVGFFWWENFGKLKGLKFWKKYYTPLHSFACKKKHN